MRAYKIYLIRHGLTLANSEGRYVGRTDVNLSEQGKNELLQKVENFEYPNVGKVYSSPLKRCKQTAEILYPGHKINVIDNFAEYHFGDYENKLPQELEQCDSFNKWIKNEEIKAPPNGEDMQVFNSRIVSAMDEMIKDMMKNNISEAAAIVHGGVIMGILANCGLPKRKHLEWLVQNGCGYSLLVNASLWGNTTTFEVCDKLPYEK